MANRESPALARLSGVRRCAVTADDWIAHLQLAPHPESGYFRRNYTAALVLDLPDRSGPRPVATAIYTNSR